MADLDERSEHRRRKRQNRIAQVRAREAKGTDVPIIQSQVPDVAEGFHILAIEFVELVEGTAYGQPDVPETRLKMQVRVETPDEPEARFDAWMSLNTGEKATLGSIIRAAIGQSPRGDFDTDLLIGKKFGSMVTINDAGYPKLVSGTAAAVREKSKKSSVIKASGGDASGGEAPFARCD